MLERSAVEFELPSELEAREPAEVRGHGRDDVRLLVGRGTGSVSHHRFTDLHTLLEPGDVLVVNRSGTLPAAIDLADGRTVHFSTLTPVGSWLVELRRGGQPDPTGSPGDQLALPGGESLTLRARHMAGRLWHVAVTVLDVRAYLLACGRPIRYGYVAEPWPLSAYQTTFASVPGSAEMPSAARPFTPEIVTRLVSRGVLVVPITLHTGVASPEFHEPPYAEWFDVPDVTVDVVNAARSKGRRVIAVGTTAVRALETAVDLDGLVRPRAGWTELVVTPERGVRAVDGLLTGLHEPKASHLLMLEAIAGAERIRASYAAAIAERYLWHEFGDVNLLL